MEPVWQMRCTRLERCLKVELASSASYTLSNFILSSKKHCATFSKVPFECLEQVVIECDGVAPHLPVHLEGNFTFRLLKNETVKACNESISSSGETEGIELRIASIWHRRVLNFSNDNFIKLNTLLNHAS
ncbi:hypothetical protein CEXT_391101 [Caerostris extrusa]|uniref:Uncharacterized protein n=1 Tax=Caerostris extrusa TaxID=172846 RepID=A0AAV4Y6F0_CAEEX|nr:hypothetical protein CEXT_391101 [Caerostris extrusa]